MRALIAMSGGVDSSVAAKVMTDRGYECIGCTMKLYESSEPDNGFGKTCCALSDVEDARSVAYRLGMRYYVFNFKDAFREKVMQKFAESYLHGYTPNPCIDCNRYMKFEKLYERATILGCDKIVSGHYARIEQVGDKYILRKALDDTKDQSYVLYAMTQEQLAHTVFPLGDMKKSDVRRLAEENGFVNADKPDSQDICFAPDGNYARVIEELTGETSVAGNFVDAAGKIYGQHRGIIHYTIGQRKGLGISAPNPLYVCGICPDRNEVVLGDADELFSSSALVEDFNWISGEVPESPIHCKAKIRYRQPEQWVTATPLTGARVRLTFDEPQRAVTPGQAAVLYDGDIVLGGGTITAETEGQP